MNYIVIFLQNSTMQSVSAYAHSLTLSRLTEIVEHPQTKMEHANELAKIYVLTQIGLHPQVFLKWVNTKTPKYTTRHEMILAQQTDGNNITWYLNCSYENKYAMIIEFSNLLTGKKTNENLDFNSSVNFLDNWLKILWNDQFFDVNEILRDDVIELFNAIDGEKTKHDIIKLVQSLQ
jgi:hypothetical protein